MPIRQGGILASRASTWPTRPLLPQHDGAARIVAHDVERVLADTDADHSDRGIGCLRHSACSLSLAPLRRLQPLRYLHDCSDCFRLERLPGGTCTHWKAPPFARRTPKADIRSLACDLSALTKCTGVFRMIDSRSLDAIADVTLTSHLYSGRTNPMERHGESDDVTVEPAVRGRYRFKSAHRGLYIARRLIEACSNQYHAFALDISGYARIRLVVHRSSASPTTSGGSGQSSVSQMARSSSASRAVTCWFARMQAVQAMTIRRLMAGTD